MTEQITPSAHRSWIGLTALILISLGWMVSMLGDGFELHRSALAMPLIVLGALFGLVETLQSGRAMRTPALLAGLVAMFYFAARAFGSEVWDLGRHDLHLLSLFWLTIATVSTCVTTARQGWILLGVFVLTFAGHFGAGLYQRFVDANFVLLGLPRHSAAGVSGLFWHWNNLAALLAILLPFFLGLGLTSRRWGLRGIFFLLVAAGVFLAYLTKSRMGFVAVVAGLGSAGAVLLLIKSANWSFKARALALTSVLMVAAFAVMAMLMVVSGMSEDRGQGSDIGSALGKSSRLGLAGLAFTIWQKSPLVGSGSQSYSYLAVEHWDPEALPNWMGDPETAHNEYMQVLADYGLIGLLFILVFLLVVFGCAFFPSDDNDDPPDSLKLGLRAGAVGGLAGAMLHGIIDFQTHLLPILLLAGLAIGLLVQGRRNAGMLGRGAHLVGLLLAVVFAVTAVGRECLAAGAWAGWEKKVVEAGGKIESDRLPELKKLAEDSPHYKVSRLYGRLSYRSWRLSGEAYQLEEARWGYANAFERHPREPNTLVGYALVLDELGELDEALKIHVRAIKATSARENKYGAYGGMSGHLYKRAKSYQRSRRRAGEAFGCYLWGEQYLELSIRRGYRFGGKSDYHTRRAVFKSEINQLRAGKIKPVFPTDIVKPP